VSALRAVKRAPRFLTYAEVDIDPEDLEREGWRYVGKDDGPGAETVMDTVRRWHDREHPDPWAWCQHDLCDALRGRPKG
jgi:hypothetical protein